MKFSLDIAFFGSSLVSAYRNGSATYYRGIVRALAARGHRVTFFEPRIERRQRYRDLADPTWAEVVSYSGADNHEVDRILERARRADVLIKATGIGVFDSILEREIPRALKPGAMSIFWDVDVSTTLTRLRANASDPLRGMLPRYDVVCTNAGGPSVVREYVDLGARLCVPVHPALDPSTHFPVPASTAWTADASLLVNWSPDREQRVSDLFFDAASRLPESTFLLGGSGWDEIDAPANVRALGHVYTAEHNGLNAGARCILAPACDEMASRGWAPPARMFEAAGAGACLITNAWDGVDSFLEPDREVLVAKTGEEVAALIRDLQPVRGRTIGAAARARVLTHHTYAQRAKLLDSILIAGAPTLEAAS